MVTDNLMEHTKRIIELESEISYMKKKIDSLFETLGVEMQASVVGYPRYQSYIIQEIYDHLGVLRLEIPKHGKLVAKESKNG